MNRTRPASTGDDQYTIRQYESADLERLMALDRTVWDRRRSAEWFTWKYVDNPYLDHVPIFVVEHDGDVVGARPFLVFRLRAGPDTVLALQPSDTTVHPEHRRQGLFTRMTRHAIEYYRQREPELFFNFPNDAALGGYRKLGWERVAPRQAYYRVEDPGTFLESQVDGRIGQLLGSVSTPVTQQYYRLRSSLAPGADGVSVEQRPGVDPALVASLYEREPPAELHALRDREFYEWSLASPAWEYTTNLARRDGEIVAALLSRTRTTDGGVTVTQLAEVAPLTGGGRWVAAISALVSAVVGSADDEDLFSAVESAIPRDVLAAHGLYSGNAPPLKQLRRDPSTFVVRPVDPQGPGSWELGGRSLCDRDEWLFSFCEHDTA